MPNTSQPDSPAERPGRLVELQRVIETEIPIAASMGIQVEPAGDGGERLAITMPLDRNRNHQQTAFAGSLNALCTLTGWGMTHLELQQQDSPGVIVIRRSTIKYHQPVDSIQVRAVCSPLVEKQRQYFRDMLATKGQSKLDLEVTITVPGQAPEDRPAVVFSGSYVVLPPDHPRAADE